MAFESVREFRIEPLTKSYDRSRFECGREDYDTYFRRFALQNQKKRISVTWLEVERPSGVVAGYVTLAMNSVAVADASAELIQGLPQYPIPTLNVARLAVNQGHQGRGVGQRLLRFAMVKAVELSREVGCHAVELVADGEDLVSYYERFGFVRLRPETTRMYLPITHIIRALEVAGGKTAPHAPTIEP